MEQLVRPVVGLLQYAPALANGDLNSYPQRLCCSSLHTSVMQLIALHPFTKVEVSKIW